MGQSGFQLPDNRHASSRRRMVGWSVNLAPIDFDLYLCISKFIAANAQLHIQPRDTLNDVLMHIASRRSSFSFLPQAQSNFPSPRRIANHDASDEMRLDCSTSLALLGTSPPNECT